MAKQSKGCFSLHRLANVWLAWLTFALMAGFCPGNILLAADSVPSNLPSANATVVSLQYQEADYSVINWGLSPVIQNTPFKKEPAAALGKTIRGVLNFGSNASDSIPFLWQRGAGKFYLDLNRNHDLTDDPSGVFSASRGAYQTFSNVRLVFNTAAGKCPVLADINLYDFGMQVYCNFSVRSFWQGKLTLQGRDWQAGIVQNVSVQPGSFENGRLLLRPWENRSQPFSAYDGSLASVDFSRKLFVDGHAWQLDCIARPQNGPARPSLQFKEQSVALGELKITGQFIRRLVLAGGPYLVILDQPPGTVKIPAGSYNQPDLLLERNGVTASSKPGQSQFGRRIAVDAKTPAVLNEGGPLTNSVAASRHGEDLLLDYRLMGAGGEIYQPLNQNRLKPPQFAIYKGEKKIASGAFEFG